MPSAPAAPDPYKTAEAQTGSNIATATANTYLGNANERGPFGNVDYTYGTSAPIREARRDKDGNPITSRVWVADPNGPEVSGGSGGTQYSMGNEVPGTGGGPAGERGRWEDQVQYNEYTVPTTTRTTSLSPEQQQLYDKSLSAQNGLLDLGNSQIGRLQQTLGAPFTLAGMPARQNGIDLSGLPELMSRIDTTGLNDMQTDIDTSGLGMLQYGVDLANMPGLRTSLDRASLPAAQTSIDQSRLSAMPILDGVQRSVGSLDDFAPERQRVEDALMARMNPSLDRERARLEAQLVNQGFTRGSDAFTAQMQDFGRQENDARMAAILSAGQEQNRLLEGRIASGNFANAAQAQGFTQGLQSRAQSYGEADNNARFANDARAQLFGEESADATFQNAARAQRFQEDASNVALSNAARSQGFAENATRAQFGNAARAQGFGEASSQATFNNAARAQGFNERLEMANFGNAQREASIQEAAMVRNQPINEISALLGQTQVQAPQFSGYRPGQVQNTPVGDYVYKSADIDQRNYQAQLQAQAAANGGMFGLGSSLLGGLFKAFPSDRRVKTDIRRVGTLDNGLPVYSYRYKWGGPSQIGLMADEVEAIHPEAVVTVNGMQMVNYEEAVA